MEVFETLDPLLQTFWLIAIPASIIFILQTIMTFVGVDSFHGGYAHLEGDLGGADVPFQLFSLRNLINFLLGFSWTGISFYSSIDSAALLIVAALSIGISFVFFFFLVVKQLQKFSEDNSFQISNTLNKTAEVYLPIPQEKSGKGKVMISVNGSFHELEAITYYEKIPTGAMVRIVAIEGDNLLLVEAI